MTKRVTIAHLREIFSKYGTVDHIDMRTPLLRFAAAERRATHSRGIVTSAHAMIDYTSREEMQKAIDYMDGVLFYLPR